MAERLRNIDYLPPRQVDASIDPGDVNEELIKFQLEPLVEYYEREIEPGLIDQLGSRAVHSVADEGKSEYDLAA